MNKQQTFVYRNSLTIVLIILFAGSMTGQLISGLAEYNHDRQDFHRTSVTFAQYLASGHFLQATFENWESEFLQMGLYVLLTVSMRQAGSSESKDLEKAEEVDRKPDPTKKDAPWPVRKGGIVLALYQNSLSLAFAVLFIVSFSLHAWGSFRKYNEEQTFHGKAEIAFQKFIATSRFWFESFQNWQSEFVAVTSIVVLSIFLRQKGSPQSKPVDASNQETGT